MPIAVRQSVQGPADDWLTVEAAAALTGDTERTWQRRARWEAKQARVQSRASLAVKRPPEGGGNPVWHVHRSFDVGLTRFPTHATRDDRQRPALLTKYPQGKVELAYRKAYWLSEWRGRCRVERGTEAAIAEQIIADAKRTEGDDFPISLRALQLWRRAHDTIGGDGSIRGVEGLIDRRGNEPKGGGAHEARSQEAIDYFYGLYHARQPFTVKQCHKATLAKAVESRWTWPVSYAATVKWLRAHEQLDETCARREGPTVYSKRFMPHIEIDYTVLQPGEHFVIDHTKGDFWVREGAVQFRPWLTALIDARSRLLVGWNLGRTPQQDAIVAALRMAFRDLAIPERLHMDNGKDFLSSLLTGYTKREVNRLRKQLGSDWKDKVAHQQGVHWQGILGELGVEIVTAIRYSPWSKGLIERWYGTFQDQCSKTFATYCGHDAASKPECLDEIRYGGGDVPTLDEARTAVGEWIELYNHTAHSGQGMDQETPIAVWNRAESLRRASDEALVMLMQGRGVYRVGKNGVAFKVGSQVLTYGGASVALRRFVGRDVWVSLDPEDCSFSYAFTADRRGRRLIGRLECNQRLLANTPVEQLREAIRTMRGRRKIMAEARREQPAMIRNAAQEVRAMQAEERGRALRATGTDDHRPNVRPVRTGFEGASMPVRGGGDGGSVGLPEGDDLRLLFADDDPPGEDDDAGCAGLDDLLSDRTDAEGQEDTLDAFDDRE